MQSFNKHHLLIFNYFLIIPQISCFLIDFHLQFLIFPFKQLSAFQYAGQHSHPKQRGTNSPCKDGIEQRFNQLILAQDYFIRLLPHQILLILGEFRPLSITEPLLVIRPTIYLPALGLYHNLPNLLFLLLLFLLLRSLISLDINFVNVLVFLHFESRIIDQFLLVFQFLVILVTQWGYYIVGLIVPILELDVRVVASIFAGRLHLLLIARACSRLN